ncbi:hypothetical protein ACFC1R_21315 [Kitasatospora sp. NPDC056138]|uniref:hypothetical protein n=1 Tax=Kitasatospora sp. NPDC056138 TaxID=3345724 RepID=UPI0035D82B4F
MNAVVFLMALGATCRITRFVSKDTLAAGFRSWTADRFGDDSRPAYLVSCGWCTSIWVAAVVTPTAFLAGDTLGFRITATALTLSYVAGVASSHLD